MCGEELSAPQDQHIRHHDHYHTRRQRRIGHHIAPSSQFLEQYPE